MKLPSPGPGQSRPKRLSAFSLPIFLATIVYLVTMSVLQHLHAHKRTVSAEAVSLTWLGLMLMVLFSIVFDRLTLKSQYASTGFLPQRAFSPLKSCSPSSRRGWPKLSSWQPS